MNSISPSLQILRSAVLAWSVFSTQASAEQPTDEDKALLEIFQADPKAPAAETAPAKVASIVEKWTDYEKTQIDTLNRTISAARNIAWEILSRFL